MIDLISDQPDGSTPLDDISGLIDRRIKTRKQLFAAESENIRQVILKYLASRPSNRRAPFSFPWIFKLHKEMYSQVWTWAGEVRRSEKNVGSPKHLIEQHLLELIRDLEYWQANDTYDLIEQSARLHHRAVLIHPFENGNGRWARMLANILLKKNGQSPTVWPEETVGVESVVRREYLAAVRAADKHDLGPLIEMTRRYTPA
jgi:Fic-DOC domain mobile mystery protein B